MHRTRVFTMAASIAAATFLAGCPQSPRQICQHMVDSIDHMYARCGYPYQTRLTFDGGLTETDCSHVTRVNDSNRILHECIPWADTVDCSAVLEDPNGVPQLDASCDFSLLEGRP
jgi:hypothetical protein